MKTETLPDTRTRLLNAAADLIWAGSFHASGVDVICRGAGVHKGSFYHFFPSKTDLAIEALRMSWQAVCSEVFDPIFARESGGMARLEAMTAAVDGVQRREFSARGVYLGCPFGSLGQEMAHQDQRLQAAVHEVFEGHVDYFERAIEEAVAAGEAEPGHLRRRARSIMALMQGALLVAKVANKPAHYRDIARAVRDLARRDHAAGDAFH